MSWALQEIIVCAPGSPAVAPCISGVPAQTQAYVADAATAADMTALLAPIDAAQASMFWGASFGGILVIWSVAQIFRNARRFLN